MGREEHVDSILAYNRVRREKIYDGDTVSEFFRRVQKFIKSIQDRLTTDDLTMLRELVARMENFHQVNSPKDAQVTHLIREISADLTTLVPKTAERYGADADLEVQKLCFELKEQMTHEEVMTELARVLLPGIIKVYEAEKKRRKSNAKKGNLPTSRIFSYKK